MVSVTPPAAHPERFRRRGTFRLFPISRGGHAKTTEQAHHDRAAGVLR
jgi:hypothetical protein